MSKYQSFSPVDLLGLVGRKHYEFADKIKVPTKYGRKPMYTTAENKEMYDNKELFIYSVWPAKNTKFAEFGDNGRIVNGKIVNGDISEWKKIRLSYGTNAGLIKDILYNDTKNGTF